MQAVVKVGTEDGNLKLCDIPAPVPGPGQVKLKIHAAALRETDLSVCQGKLHSDASAVPGHEAAGEVVEIGPDVPETLLGSRVTSDPCIHGHSAYQGSVAVSASDRHQTNSEIHAGFAEYLVVPAYNVYRLPEHISYREGALAESLARTVQGVLLDSPTIRAGDLAVIAGPGAVGLLALQILKASHATVVVLGTGADSERLSLASDLGADYVVNPDTRDVYALIQDVSTQGSGADVVYECSGTGLFAQGILQLVRRRGRYVQMKTFGTSICWDMDRVCRKELIVSGSHTPAPEAWTRAIHLLAQDIVQTGPLITHDFALSEWESAFKVLEQKRGVKVLLRPHFDRA